MAFEIVSAQSQPFLHATRSATMEPGDIPRATGDGFAEIGAFFAEKGIEPAGAAVAVYRDWDGRTMKIDLGFPVSASDAQRAAGAVGSGRTPDGKALRAVHHGPYGELATTYDAMEAHIREAGLRPTGIAWEVYLNDPSKTPEADLVTEVYMQLG